MRYAEFRDRLEGALQAAGLFFQGADRRVETIDLAHTTRSWKVHLFGAAVPSADPFHVSAEIGFEWSPADAARAYTTEEDLLTELVGRRRRPIRTERRWTRIDLSLRASLPYGSMTSMPESRVLASWTGSVTEKADAAFTDIEEKRGRVVAVLGGRGDVEVHAHCKPDGVVSLTAVAIAGFRLVCVPRVWDDPERREAERGSVPTLVDWRGGSRPPSMSGRAVSRNSRPGSDTRRHRRKRNRPNRGSRIKSRTTMTTGRRRRTEGTLR